MRRCIVIAVVLSAVIVGGRTSLPGAEPEISLNDVRTAIVKAVPLLEKGSAGSADQRTCYTCHNNGVPAIALMEARRRGIIVDDANLVRQFNHTIEHLRRGEEGYRQGRGQGGAAITAGYALWTLEVAGWKRDNTTDAVTQYLLSHQRNQDFWRHVNERPPSAGSDFTTSYVALRALAVYGSEEQRDRIIARDQRVGKWLVRTEAPETEDKVFRAWALWTLGIDSAETEKAIQELVSLQRTDGGWAQNAERDSDAYATGTVLALLLESKLVENESDPIRRGVAYLLKTQCENGAWHVVTRAKPIQTYFESGFPFEKDQFISLAASGWATWSLAQLLPVTNASSLPGLLTSAGESPSRTAPNGTDAPYGVAR